MIALPLAAEDIDYSKLKPEHFDKLQDKMQFHDKQTGQNYKVSNHEFSRGLYIEVVKNKSKKWVKHGAFYTIYKGRVTQLVTYHHGDRHGVSESYNKKGIVQFRKHYVKGVQEGLWEQFNDKGEKVAECMYREGRRNGQCYDYYEGKLEWKHDYVDGKRHGKTLQYDTRTGKLISSAQYKRGKMVGKRQWH